MTRLVSVALLLLVTGHAAPVTAADGAALYRRHCQVCHGRDATDGDAGDIRGMALPLVKGALRGIEQMPAFTFTEEEIAALTEHLRSLNQR
jgi:mono/diheme cytochrome c family protein